MGKVVYSVSRRKAVILCRVFLALSSLLCPTFPFPFLLRAMTKRLEGSRVVYMAWRGVTRAGF